MTKFVGEISMFTLGGEKEETKGRKILDIFEFLNIHYF